MEISYLFSRKNHTNMWDEQTLTEKWKGPSSWTTWSLKTKEGWVKIKSPKFVLLLQNDVNVDISPPLSSIFQQEIKYTWTAKVLPNKFIAFDHTQLIWNLYFFLITHYSNSVFMLGSKSTVHLRHPFFSMSTLLFTLCNLTKSTTDLLRTLSNLQEAVCIYNTHH